MSNDDTANEESQNSSPDKYKIIDLEMKIEGLEKQINHLGANALTWGHVIVFVILFPVAFVAADNRVKVWGGIKACFSFLSDLGESMAGGALALVGIKSGFETAILIVGAVCAVLVMGSVLAFILLLIARIIDRRKK